MKNLLFQIEQISSPIDPSIGIEDFVSFPSSPLLTEGLGAYSLYRLVDGGMSICAQHLAQLSTYAPKRLEARAVLSVDQIDSLAAEFGLRREDLLTLHGPMDPIFGEERCRMCESIHVDGNRCVGCDAPLHPQWPAVYCSSRCAMGDLF